MNVTVDVLEPMENGKIVFAAIAPAKKGGPQQGRISMRMRIKNNEATAIQISKIEIMGQAVSNFTSPVEVAADGTFEFQNGNIANALPLIIDAPFPTTAKVAVFLANVASPVEKVVSIGVHTNDGGPFMFLGRSSDLRRNEAWGASSQHRSGHQAFALDLGVLGWAQNAWSERFPGSDASRKESYRIYGMPVYAMADGTVCWALNDHQERPTIADAPTISPSLGVFVGGGNQIFIKTGDEVTVYAHLQPSSIPPELLVTGAAVSKGQYIGKVGLSGSTSHPHIHIHTKKQPASGAPEPGKGMNNCDAGPFRPMGFKELQSLTLEEANTMANSGTLDAGDWTQLTNNSAPHPYGLLYPSTAAYGFAKDATDSRQYIGVWRAGSEIELRVNATGWSDFVKKWGELSNDTFRLVKMETFVENNQRQFIGIFKRGSGGHYLWNAPSWDTFVSKWKELSQSGQRLIDITTYAEGTSRHFIGVFRSGNDGHALWSITGWSAFTAKWEEFSKAGLRLVDLETYPVGGDRQYIGVFREGNHPHALWSITGWSAFTAKWDEFSKNGLRLMDIETFPVGDQRQFIGVFHGGSGGYALESVTGYHRFVQSCEKWNANNLRLVDVHVEQQ